MELVAAQKYWSKIDLGDGFHNIRIEEDSEQHFTFLTAMKYYHSRIMQQGDHNALAIMVRATSAKNLACSCCFRRHRRHPEAS